MVRLSREPEALRAERRETHTGRALFEEMAPAFQDADPSGDWAGKCMGRVWAKSRHGQWCWVSWAGQPGGDLNNLRAAKRFADAANALAPDKRQELYDRAFAGDEDCEDVLAEIQSRNAAE